MRTDWGWGKVCDIILEGVLRFVMKYHKRGGSTLLKHSRDIIYG